MYHMSRASRPGRWRSGAGASAGRMQRRRVRTVSARLEFPLEGYSATSNPFSGLFGNIGWGTECARGTGAIRGVPRVMSICSPSAEALLRAGRRRPRQGQRPISIVGQTEAGASTVLGSLKPAGFGW